jgi:uncharacterized membrane protein
LPKSEVNALTKQMTNLQVTRPPATVAESKASKKRTIGEISKDAVVREPEEPPKKTRKFEARKTPEFTSKEELKVGEKSETDKSRSSCQSR